MSPERAPREKPRGQKADLYKWVNDQQQLDMRTKYILEKLADYAQPDCTSWSPIATLAYAANCSERTVQYHLRALEAEGLMRPTGRSQRLDDSSRSVPIYQLAPDVEGLGAPRFMGAKIAPIAPASVQSTDAMGATGLHPVMEIQETLSGAEAPSPGARAIETLFAEFEAAVPTRCWKNSDRQATFEAFVALAEQGVDVSLLAGCARRMGGDPVWLSKRVPEPMERWIQKFQWRGWAAEEGSAKAEVGAGGVAAAFDGPDWLRELIVAAQGEAFARTTIDFCRFEAGDRPRLIARTGWIEQQLRKVSRELADHGVVVEGRA